MSSSSIGLPWPAAAGGAPSLSSACVWMDGGLNSGGSIGCGRDTGGAAGCDQAAAPAVPGSEICAALNTGPGCAEPTVRGKKPAVSTTNSASATTAA